MSNYGFYIRKVCIIGNNVKRAIVEFDKGLNIISGPSDTGKSYIFECINYMLGSTKEPKKIKEANGYSSVLMEIELYSGGSYTIRRNFGTDDVYVYPVVSQLIENSTVETLNLKHDKEKTDNLSAFYLGKSGYNHPIHVRVNKKGKNRTLSFRDFPLYVAISEDKVIKSHSPILSGQFQTPTVEKSIFNFIVSGIDSGNGNQNQNESSLSTTKLEGQKELLDKLVAREEAKLTGFSIKEPLPKNTLEDKMNDIQQELENISNEIEHQTKIRRSLWNKLEEYKSKSIAESELIKRFRLLKDYYDTDLERLSFVIDGNHYFSQLNFSICPYCNQQLNGKCIEHNGEFNEHSGDLAISIEVEINKIRGKLIDLESTLEQAESDYYKLNLKIEESQWEYNNIKGKIDSILQPKQFELKELLQSYIKERDQYKEYQLIDEKLEDLKAEISLINVQLKNKRKTKTINNNTNDGVIVASINEFCKYMSRTLKRWKFSTMPEVHFENGTFFIDSKPAEDYGKGYRAIIYSGFAISLMQYCKAKNMPHPGFVVLDSPLTTYRGKKSQEDINGDIQYAFFNDVASLNNDIQIIILDNKEPNNEVRQKINYEEFTKDINKGRYGFFPYNIE